MRKLSRLKVTNYRGIASIDIQIGDGATVAQGSNGAGKTTLLNAIRAALEARDVGPDAIRLGEDSAEILVDLDDVHVRRAITKRGTSLTVSREAMDAKRPQHYLDELLGTSGLDPLALMTLKPKERRAHILAALPCRVTHEQLVGWAPDLPPGVDVSGHGLEVLEQVRAIYYDRRTDSNRRAEESAGTARRARATLGDVVIIPETPSVTAATNALELANLAEQRLQLRADEAAQQERRQQKARDNITKKKAAAEDLRANAPAEVNVTPLEDEVHRLQEVITSLRRQLELTIEEANVAGERWKEARASNAARAASLRSADAEEAQAIELAETLAENAIAPPTADELAASKEALTQARIGVAKAKGAEALTKQLADVQGLENIATRDAADAARLDQVVKTLTNEAPKALFTEGAIPGLQLDGEKVLLDGKRLDALSGREQMKLCIEIARRANVKARFLIVDGLERVDPDSVEEFVREATRDGWQLLGTRVDRGGLVVEHIGPGGGE